MWDKMTEKKPLLFTVFVEVRAANKEEFNRWYNQVHVPEVMECPGFLSARRYEAVDLEASYMAAYQLSGEDAMESPEFAVARGWKEMKPEVIQYSLALYEHIYTAPPGSAARSGQEPTLLRFNRSNAMPEKEEEYNRWYNHVHLPDLLECPGWLSAFRYRAIRGEPKYLALYDISGPSAFESPEFLKARGWKEMEPYVYDLSNVTYRPIFEYQRRE